MQVDPNDPVRLFAATLFSETKDIRDSKKIASVIMNRMNKPQRYGSTIPEVIMQPHQFSGVGGNEFNKAYSGKLNPDEESIYKNQLAIASAAYRGNLPDDTDGANHYVNLKLAKPKWIKGMTKTGSTKFHTYYREE